MTNEQLQPLWDLIIGGARLGTALVTCTLHAFGLPVPCAIL